MRINHVLVFGAVCGAAWALTGVFGIRSSAAATSGTPVSYTANFCHPTLASIDRTDRSSIYGILNPSAVAATIECPIRVPTATSGFAGGSVVVYDRNNQTNVTCTLYGLGTDGGTLWSNTQSSTGFSWAIQVLQFPAQNAVPWQMNMECTIPPVETGTSHVEMYQMSL